MITYSELFDPCPKEGSKEARTILANLIKYERKVRKDHNNNGDDVSFGKYCGITAATTIAEQTIEKFLLNKQ